MEFGTHVFKMHHVNTTGYINFSDKDYSSENFNLGLPIFTPLASNSSLFTLHTASLVVCASLLVLEVILGIFGNAVVCVTVYKNKSLRTPMNALIVNLCIADLVISIAGSPILIYLILDTDHMTSGSRDHHTVALLSELVHICQVMSGTVLLVTLVSISVERYHAIAQPFDKANRWKRIKFSISFSWILSAINVLFGLFIPDMDSKMEPAEVSVHHVLVRTFHSSFIKMIFIPFSLFCMLLILSLYFSIIYLIQKHVSNSNKKLFSKPSVKNKVAPEKVSTIPTPELKSLGPDFVIMKKGSISESVRTSLEPQLLPQVVEKQKIVKENEVAYLQEGKDKKQHNSRKKEQWNKTLSSPDSSICLRNNSNVLKNKTNYSNTVKDDKKANAKSSRNLLDTDDFITKPDKGKNCDEKGETMLKVKHKKVIDISCTESSQSNIQVYTISNEQKEQYYKPTIRHLSNDNLDEGVDEEDVFQLKHRSHVDLGADSGICAQTDEVSSQVTEVETGDKQLVLKKKPTGNGDNTIFVHTNGVVHLAVRNEASEMPDVETVSLYETAKTASSAVAAEKHGPSETHENEEVKDKDEKNRREAVIEICDMEGGKVKATTTRSEVVGNICVMNSVNKERGKRRFEARTAKVTAIVIAAFLMCWLPLPSVNLSAVCLHTDDPEMTSLIKEVLLISLTVSNMAAAINPIAYGLLNRQIRNGIARVARHFTKTCN